TGVTRGSSAILNMGPDASLSALRSASRSSASGTMVRSLWSRNGTPSLPTRSWWNMTPGPDVTRMAIAAAARIGAVMTIATLATIRSKVRLAARRQLNWATGSTHMTGYGPSGRTEIRLAAMSRMDEV